jgi:hypothetical protein
MEYALFFTPSWMRNPAENGIVPFEIVYTAGCTAFSGFTLISVQTLPVNVKKDRNLSSVWSVQVYTMFERYYSLCCYAFM